MVDQLNDRIEVFGPGGEFGGVLAGGANLKRPYGIALSPDGDQLYVSDTGHNEIAVLDLLGRELGRFGGFGAADGKFHGPHGLFWDVPARLLYVADTHNNRVQVFGYEPAVVAEAVTRPEKLRLPARAATRASRGSIAGNGIVNSLSVAPNPFDPKNGDILAVGFNLAVPASVGVSVASKHGDVIWLGPVGQFGAGVGTITWNGYGADGHVVQGGTYDLKVAVTAGGVTVSQVFSIAVVNRGGQVPGGQSQGNGSASPGAGSGKSPKGRAK